MQLVPLLVGATIGGVVGDALDRRLVIVVAAWGLALSTAALAVNAATAHPSTIVIYIVAGIAAAFGGVASTVTSAVVPSVVDRSLIVPAYAAMQLVDQTAMVAAPLLSGVLIAVVQLAWAYGIAATLYACMALAVGRMASAPPDVDTERPGLRSVLAGVRYVSIRQELSGAYLVDLSAMIFGLPRSLFPSIATNVFHGGAGVLGALYAAPAAGAFLGTIASGRLTRIRRVGLAVLAAVAVWAGVIIAFGFVHVLWIALVILAVAGWADVISAVLRTTILQTAVAERFRSRVSALQVVVVEGGPRMGDFEAGAVATLTSLQLSIVSGGVACLVGTLLIGALLPGFPPVPLVIGASGVDVRDPVATAGGHRSQRSGAAGGDWRDPASR